MNHIYKVIWNRTRACWQVVSELAKGCGRVKSLRRRSRRAAAGQPSAESGRLRNFSGKAAVALALVAACALSAAPGVARAADVEETYASGVLSYGNYADGRNVFKDWQAGNIFQQGSSLKTVILNTGFFLRMIVNGIATSIGDTSLKDAFDTYNQGKTGSQLYHTFVAVVNGKTYTWATLSSDGSTVTLNYTSSTIMTTINNDYWKTLNVAQALAQAYQDSQSTDAATKAQGEAALQALINNGLPHLYLVADDGTQQELGVGNSSNPIRLSTTTLNFAASPSDASYAYSYPSKTVAAGGVWRPLDRTTTAGALAGTYTVGQRWIIGADGTVTQSGTTTSTANNGSGSVVTNSTVITVGNLTVGKGGTIDLAYLNTAGSDPIVNHIGTTTDQYGTSYSGLYGTGIYYTTSTGLHEYERSANRTLLVNNATLADGTVFRLGAYGLSRSLAANKTTIVNGVGANDSVYIYNAATPDGNKAKLYVQIAWMPGVGTASQGDASGVQVYTGNTVTSDVLGILYGANNFTVTGQTSLADGIFSQYSITPVIGKREDYFTDASGNAIAGSTVWYLASCSYYDTGNASESGRSAADNAVAVNNLWRNNYLNSFRRVGSLHRQGFSEQRVAMLGGGAAAASAPAAAAPGAPSQEPGSPQPEGETAKTLGIASYPVTVEDQKENAWAEVWHGQYKSAAGYGRQVGQNYNGMQVGYDKLLRNSVADGKVYAGFYLSKVDGRSTTATGGGDQDSQGVGFYGTWVGRTGHYLDAALLVSRLQDDYHLTANTGSGATGRVTGDYSTWAYGLGLQYGYQTPVSRSGWFFEPSASLFLGRTDGASYCLSNNLGIQQGDANSMTARLGLKAGKQLDGGRSSVYAGLAALHEFSGQSSVSAFYGNQHMPLDTAGGRDTWWEYSLGGNWRISPTGVFNLDLAKTAGSSIGNTWQVNGSLNWTWGGVWSGETAKTAVSGELSAPAAGKANAAGNATIIVGQAPAVTVPAPQTSGTAKSGSVQPAADAPTGITAAAGDLAEQPTTVFRPDTPAVSLPTGAGEFALAPLTVEAARPDWEKQLSPGQVSVIYPSRFDGEQKDLPDLLERVPGLYVQRVSGDGHYTVARVRGSTAAQVNVYVDGVLMNLNGDAAVNLSTIPVDNVERIEVYRGYVPARFAGAPLGGVINIVTKKPRQVGGTITQGFKSYGGYNATYELTAPAGQGSLLATFQRDIWAGDFPFRMVSGGKDLGEYHRRSNGYQNDNGLVKWQDDHWLVKAAWKQLHEQLPSSVSSFQLGTGGGGYKTGYTDYYDKGYYDAEQDIDQQEFQIGRRETAGNLDWGWRLSYLDSTKHYRNTGKLKAVADGLWSTLSPDPGTLWANYHSKKWGANYNAAFKLGGSHLLELNADLSRETMDCNGNDWDKSLFNSATTTDEYDKIKLLKHYEIKEYHLTLQDTVTLNEAGDFKLTPVVRADKVEMATLSAADSLWKYSGGLALQKQFNSHWSVKTTWGTYNRHPNFYEIFGDGAYIRPNACSAKFFDVSGPATWETGSQFDFSINWQGKLAKADTDTVLTWFQRRSENQFALWVPAVPNAPSVYFPMDTAKVHGVELTHNMQWNRLTLSLAGTWQQSEYTDGQMRSGHKSSISYTPEWVWNARLDYRFPGDRLNVFTEYHYTDQQFLGVNDDKSYDQYLAPLETVNLGFKYAFDKRWKLSAGVNDLFNKGYDQRKYQLQSSGLQGGYVEYLENDTANYPVVGRMYYATMEYKF